MFEYAADLNLWLFVTSDVALKDDCAHVVDSRVGWIRRDEIRSLATQF